MDATDELLTVAEVARYLGVTPHTVYRWVAAGRLPALRFSPKVIRVRRSDLEAFSRRPASGVAEPKPAYRARSSVSEAEYEREREEVRLLLDRYRKLAAKLETRPRGKDEPPKGSPAALLRHAGVISKEEGEELRRVIREAKTYSPPPEL